MFQNIRSLFVLAIAVILVTCASGCFRTRVDWKEPSYVPSPIGLFRPINQLQNSAQLYTTALQQEELQLDSCVDLYFEVAMATCHDDGGTQGDSNQCLFAQISAHQTGCYRSTIWATRSQAGG